MDSQIIFYEQARKLCLFLLLGNLLLRNTVICGSIVVEF